MDSGYSDWSPASVQKEKNNTVLVLFSTIIAVIKYSDKATGGGGIYSDS